MIRDALMLARPRVSLLAGAATLTGYVLIRPALDAPLALAVAGAVLTASGASAVNQIQERHEDGLMRRTKYRPLPAGRLGLAGAALVSAAYLILGLTALALAHMSCLAIGAMVLVVYNGLYTPLKKITPACVLVGGLAGAAPPLLGCAAAGGGLSDPAILGLALVLYLWQTPHFWLLARRHRDDYLTAGFKTAPAFEIEGESRLPYLAWLGSLGAAMLMTGAFAFAQAHWRGPAAYALVALAAAATLAAARGGKHAFASVNLSLCLFLAALAARALWPHGAAVIG